MPPNITNKPIVDKPIKNRDSPSINKFAIQSAIVIITPLLPVVYYYFLSPSVK